MNADTTWLLGRLDELESNTKRTGWQLSELQHARSEAAPVWNDQCAAVLTSRFLAPLTSNAEESLAQLTRQAESVRACTSALDGADAMAKLVHAACEHVRDHIGKAETVLRSLDSVLNEVFARIAESERCVADAHRHLAAAKAAGASG